MKSRLLILLSIVLMVAVLAALNAASYVRVEEEAETELLPDRSTENSGGTGTRALFEYLRQRGVEAVRWGEPFEALAGAEAPESLVLVGPLRRELEMREADELRGWVARGGRLVIIDRAPSPMLLPSAGEHWRIHSEAAELPTADSFPGDVENMTRGVPLLSPAQPTALTRNVVEVTRSRFAARLHVYPAEADTAEGRAEPPPGAEPEAQAPAPAGGEDPWGEDEGPPPPAPVRPQEGPGMSAPVVHVPFGRDGTGALLLDYSYGRGRVVILSDPYLVSNAGIFRADNLFLATNVVTGGSRGRVAFDEFHHGYGEARNRLFAYFRGTPILWMFAQGALVALALVWTRGRRFARAIPAPRPDRRSKLEFVSSMAELQQRARAYDLAVENIYQQTRRALARYAGLPAAAPLAELAERVAARSGRDRARLEALLRECEDAAAGAPLRPRRAVALARELRELERDLRLLMRSREIRQAR